MFQIPEENLPECLRDEERISVLFAPFRNSNVNPKDRDSKISSWKSIIQIYCDTNDVYLFSVSSLNKVFVRNGRPPSCLSEVIMDMVRNGDVQIEDVFLRKNPETWGGWATDLLVKRPLSWSYNKMNSMFTAANKDENCVHLEVIRMKCEALLDSIPEKCKNKLISLKDLLSLQGKNCKIDNVKLLLHYLSNQRKIYITKLNSSKGKNELDTFLIKFGIDNNITPISDIDIGVYNLEQNEQIVSKSIELLEEDIQLCIKEAKIHLSKNHKQMAKSSLRKKHELEKRAEKKAKALHNIQILLEQIHETHSDAHVFNAYKSAIAAFNTSFKDAGISEDAIDDTMLELGEILDKHDNLQAALSRPAQETNDSDLEEELAELLKSDSNQLDTSDLDQQMKNLSLNVPAVPDDSPNVSQQGISLNE